MSRVMIICGSESDKGIAEKVERVLDDFNVDYSLEYASAHRNPEKVERLVSRSDAEVFIAIAGLSAALPGVVASKTIRPVVGVPVSAKLGGLDALLSIAQMPSRIPVASVGIDNGSNAAYLALGILSIKDRELAARLNDFRKKMKS